MAHQRGRPAPSTKEGAGRWVDAGEHQRRMLGDKVTGVNEQSPGFKGGGRPHTHGTVLARVMTQRHIRVHQVSTIFHVSDRCTHNYLTRKRPVPVLHLGALCDFLNMDPDELVDNRNFLLEE